MEELGKVGLTGTRIRDIRESGVNEQGRRCSFSFLTRTVLMRKI